MIVEVNEIVEVVVVFKKDKVVPIKLKWNNRVYHIDKVNMVHHTYEGQVLIHYFSVSDSANSFKLAFNTNNLKWTLDEVYHEG